jgi:thymidylate kinase
LPDKNLIEANQPFTEQEVKMKVAHALLAALTSDCKAYCILSGYEQFPDSFASDIDFMVSKFDFPRMPGIINNIARRTHTRLFQTIDHEITGRAFWLVSQSEADLTIVQPDSTADYRHFGLLWLHSDEVLAARRWYSRGFWIPAAAHEFAYCLVKRLNKRSFNREHGRKLHRLYDEDSSGCDEIISRFWDGSRRTLVRRMAASDDWTAMAAELDALRKEMRQHSAESIVQKTLLVPKRVRALMKRVSQPTGGCVAIMGPDGAGKSLVIGAVRDQLSSAFRKVQYFHLRPRLLPGGGAANVAVTNPHGRPPRGRLASIAKVFFLLADYCLGYLLRLAPSMMRSDMIIFDRYFYDLLVDSKRVRYGGPLWLLRLATRLVPQPDIVILLDAPADVLWARKQEVPFEEVVRQREGYLQVASELPSAIVVDAAQSPSDVIGAVLRAIVEFYATRTARRLQLEAAPLPAKVAGAEATSHQC